MLTVEFEGRTISTNIQLLRSSVAQKRPNPASLLEGQPAVNINAEEPGLFFKATDGTLLKVGPVAITNSGQAPNAGAAGPSGNLAGETWLDGRTTYTRPVLKVFDGTQWRTSSGFAVDDSTGDFSLAKRLTVSTLVVNGTGANSFVRLPNGPSGDETVIPAAAGMVRFDTTLNQFRGYNGTQWIDLSSGVLTSLSVSGNAAIGGTLSVNGNVTLGNDCTIDTVTINAATNIACNATVGVSSVNTLSVIASTTFSSPTRHVNQQPVRFYAGTITGSNYVALRAPTSIAANVTWTLPNADGSPGQFLRTNGSGSLSWSASQGPIQEFDNAIVNNYNITPSNNALSVGTIAINPGVTVTIPVNSRWVVV